MLHYEIAIILLSFGTRFAAGLDEPIRAAETRLDPQIRGEDRCIELTQKSYPNADEGRNG